MKIVAYTTILFAASFINALPVAQQQQQPQQQQQQQQQPQQNQQQQQCTMDMLKGYMITSPVNFVAEPQQILPERGQFVDPTNTTILLSNPQGQGNQQGGNQTVPVKFNNQTEVSTEILQNSVYAISWMKTSDSGQAGKGQQSQSGQGGQGQQQPQSGQGVQAQQAQQGGQGQGGQGQKSQQQMISPIRVQLVSQNGTLLNVTETLGVLSTGGQKQQQQSGQQPSGQQQGNQTSQMQAAQQQLGDQNQPQSGQQQGNQSSQQQPASGQRKPGQEGAVVVHLGPEIQPGIYSFLLSAQVQPQQQGGQRQQQQQQQQQQGPLCQIMTMPFRIRAASDLQQSGSSGNSTSST